MVQYTNTYQCNLSYNQTERKNHKIISLDTEKSCDKIQPPFILTDLKRSGIQGTYLNIINAIYS